jgi:hypothetical protein
LTREPGETAVARSRLAARRVFCVGMMNGRELFERAGVGTVARGDSAGLHTRQNRFNPGVIDEFDLLSIEAQPSRKDNALPSIWHLAPLRFRA